MFVFNYLFLENSESGSSAVFPLGKEVFTGYDRCPQDHPEFVFFFTIEISFCFTYLFLLDLLFTILLKLK